MTHDSRSRRNVLSISPVKRTPCLSSSPANSGSTLVVMNFFWPPGSASFSVPWRNRLETPTVATLPSRNRRWKSL